MQESGTHKLKLQQLSVNVEGYRELGKRKPIQDS